MQSWNVSETVEPTKAKYLLFDSVESIYLIWILLISFYNVLYFSVWKYFTYFRRLISRNVMYLDAVLNDIISSFIFCSLIFRK